MTLPLTIGVSSFATRTSPTGRVLIAAGIVTIGFLVGITPPSFSSLSFSLTPDSLVGAVSNASHSPGLISLIYGLFSALFIAIHSVLIKSSLPHCSGSTIKLAYWTNLGSAILLAPFMLLKGEPFRVMQLLAEGSEGQEWNSHVFVWGSITTGIFGFLLCIAGLLSIKVTSPITHMFSSVSICFLLYLPYRLPCFEHRRSFLRVFPPFLLLMIQCILHLVLSTRVIGTMIIQSMPWYSSVPLLLWLHTKPLSRFSNHD